MKEIPPKIEPAALHCAICGRELSAADLQEGLGGGLLLCHWCRAAEESCGCADGE